MNYVCPVCNGFQNIDASCSYCNHQLDDHGRIDDFFGPYSPYREIDHLKLTNGYDDLENHQCFHVTTCPNCGKDRVIAINEIFEA